MQLNHMPALFYDSLSQKAFSQSEGIQKSLCHFMVLVCSATFTAKQLAG